MDARQRSFGAYDRHEGLLSKTKNVAPVLINLPNGTHTLAIKQGTVAFGEKLNLTKILYVPNPSCNLVSIARTYRDLHYTVTFFDDFCIVQDCTLRMLIDNTLFYLILALI